MPRKDKPLYEYTFDELLTWATWQVMDGIAKGSSLRDSLYVVFTNVCNWQAERTKKEGKKK